jgi:hypothetical protein
MNALKALTLSRSSQHATLLTGVQNELAQVQESITAAAAQGRTSTNVLFYRSRIASLEVVATYLRNNGYQVSLRGQGVSNNPAALYVVWAPHETPQVTNV